MKKMCKRLCCFGCILVLMFSLFGTSNVEVLSVTAEAATITASGMDNAGLSWMIDSNGTLSVNGRGEMGSDYPWSEYKDSIRNVVIGEGVTTICDRAFGWNDNIINVSLPSTLVSIGEDAFRDNQFSEITIPSGVSSIGECAFISNYELKSIKIPSGITQINDSTFSGCKKLKTIDLPDTLTDIKGYAFFGIGATSIKLPNSLKSIGDLSFGGSELTEITIPLSVEWIGYNCFEDCRDLKKVYMEQIKAPEVAYNCWPGYWKDDADLSIYVPNGAEGYTEYPWSQFNIIYGSQSDNPMPNMSGGDGKKVLHGFVMNGIEGEEDYGCDNDAAMIYTRLCDNELSGYEVKDSNIHPFSYNCERSAVGISDVNQRIIYSLKDADEDDLSVFYYTGHSTWNGESAADYGITLGTGWYPWADLASFLANNVKGQIVVIMDACFSGSFITTGIASLSENEKNRFTVISSCTEREESSPKSFYNFFYGSLNYGCFTYFLGEGIGFVDDELKADTNKDGKVNVGELYTYVNQKVVSQTKNKKFPMNVELYTNNRNLVVFEYHSGNSIIKENQSISVKGNLSIVEGEKVALGATAKTKLLYSSSNENVAIVDSNGTVTAKSAGTAAITITAISSDNYNSATETVLVTVTSNNAIITRLKGSRTTITSVKPAKKKLTVKYSKINIDGVKYQIAIKKKGDNKWKKYSSTKTSFTKKSLKKNKVYSVSVRPYKKINGKTYYGKWSVTKYVKVK